MSELTQTQQNTPTPIDLETLPDLSKAKESTVDLIPEYWTPETPGETKRLFFAGLANVEDTDEETGETRTRPTVYFYEKAGGELKLISNASKRLLGAFESGAIQQGQPIVVTYLGKIANKTNAFKSDNWKVKKLIVEG